MQKTRQNRFHIIIIIIISQRETNNKYSKMEKIKYLVIIYNGFTKDNDWAKNNY